MFSPGNIRRKTGILIAILAPVVFVLLAVGEVRLITMSERHSAGTGATSVSMSLHWPLLIPLVMLVAGVVLAVLPRRARQEA